ncbi:MAG: helix-turn-helix domain-containing protein [Candidatus Nanopelagicales bacterium]
MSAQTLGRETLTVRPQQRTQASQVLEQLDGRTDDLAVGLATRDGDPKQVPAELAAIIGRVIEVMANGGTVVLGSLPEELSTTVAAEQLGISRPTLMKLIRAGEIPAHKVGSHHRIRTADLLAFRQRRLERQRQAFADLREFEDGLGGL